MKNDEMKRSGLNRFVRADEHFGKAMQDFFPQVSLLYSTYLCL